MFAFTLWNIKCIIIGFLTRLWRYVEPLMEQFFLYDLQVKTKI